MTLEEIIDDAARRGELVHLSVSNNASGKGFSASYGPASGFGVTIVYDESPSKALHRAIAETKLRAKRPTSNYKPEGGQPETLMTGDNP